MAVSAPFMACATGTPSGGSAYNTGTSSGDNGGGTSSGTASGGNGSGANGSGSASGFATTSSGASSGGDGGNTHMQRCDDAGNCTCISIASLGYEGLWGPCSTDSTTAFQTWLNTQSTAHVDTYNTQPMLTPQFLSQYDVIILQWMVNDVVKGTSGVNEGTPWTFTSDEIAAVQQWVQNGGGIIALSGYNCQDAAAGCTVKDNVATNQLLSFTDMQFNSDNTLNGSPNNTTSVCAAENCYCWGASLPLGIATPAIAAPLTTAQSTSMGYAVGAWVGTTPIGANVTDIGAFNGRSIAVKSPGTAGTVVVDANDTTLTYSAHEQIGKGGVVMYGDEWLTYTGEWTGMSTCQSNLIFTGGVPPAVPCGGKDAADVFQIPQFWYNAIKYASGSVQCFTIMNPHIVY